MGKIIPNPGSAFDVDKILKTTSIIDVAREFGLIVSKNVIPCIKRENHVEQNGAPSLTFNLVRNTFKCWVCPDVCGDVIDLVMQLKNVDREKAIQFLTIRSEIKSEGERNEYFSEKKYDRQSPATKNGPNVKARDTIFQEFLDGMNTNRGIDLIAFASTKGGTGKTLVVNNIAVIVSLITRYIGNHQESEPQLVELIDLDFGKPDQRLLLGIEPQHYLEDIFYQNPDTFKWDLLRQITPLESLNFISSSPVRKSNSMYYRKKNEILYMLHNSDAHVKLADFGGGSDKDTLDFLSSIKSKVYVINPDRASVEAVFNLILSLLYFPMKKRFKSSGKALDAAEKFRNCHRTGYTIENMLEELKNIDKSKNTFDKIKDFYGETVLPFMHELDIPETANGNLTIEHIKEELPAIKQRVFELLFSGNGKNSPQEAQSNRKKSLSGNSSMYRTYTTIEKTIHQFDSYACSLNELLKTSLFGLIINKADEEEAGAIAEDLVRRVSKSFSMDLTYLGNIPEEKALRNISNYGMPYVVFNSDHPVLEKFFSITDTILNLKEGSTARIIHDQKDFIRDLKKNWTTLTKSPKNKPAKEASTA